MDEGPRRVRVTPIYAVSIDQGPAKVVDLMEALRRSLNAVSVDKKMLVKADLKKPAAKAKAVAPVARKRKAG